VRQTRFAAHPGTLLTIVYETEVGYFQTTRRGFGDTMLRLKFNCWGNDSGVTALALMPFATFATSQEGVGLDHFEAGLFVPFSAALSWDFYLGMPSLEPVGDFREAPKGPIELEIAPWNRAFYLAIFTVHVHQTEFSP